MTDIDMARRKLAERGFKVTKAKAPIRSSEAVESGGQVREISEEAVLAEARRLGFQGQVPAGDLNAIRRRLAGDFNSLTYAEACERAGATLKHARMRGWR
jgi:hypothetical protein